MSKEYKLLHEVCVRCENYIDGLSCKSMDECPVYKLYEIARGIKPKVVWCNDFPMTEEEKGKVALGYAWSHNHVFVNKETFERARTPLEKIVAIPVGDIVETAVLFGLNYTVQKNKEEQK